MNEYEETYRGIGKLHSISQNVKNGEGSLIVVNFLDELIRAFAKHSAKYINKIKEAPFVYSERQLTSIFAPALAEVANAFLAEHPVKRQNISIKKRKEEGYNYAGWVDFWVNYKGFDYYIELKHDYDSFNSGKIRKSAQEKWTYMNEVQLPDLEKEANYLSSERKGIFTISLEVITIYNYRDKKYRQELKDDLADLKIIQERYFNTFRDCNWCGLWVLHDKLVKNCYYEDDTHLETYPGVLFLSKVKKIK
jgi:hypothetical protein